ncbi:hypothetical protein [Methanothrix sp.]
MRTANFQGERQRENDRLTGNSLRCSGEDRVMTISSWRPSGSSRQTET